MSPDDICADCGHRRAWHHNGGLCCFTLAHRGAFCVCFAFAEPAPTEPTQ